LLFVVVLFFVAALLFVAFGVLPIGLGRAERWRRFGRRRRLIARLEIGVAGELEVPARAVHFARLLEALADLLLRVVLAGVHLEERLQILALDDGVAGDVEVADLIPRSFGDRNPHLDPAGLLVLGVAQDLQLGNADVRPDVPAVAVVLDDL